MEEGVPESESFLRPTEVAEKDRDKEEEVQEEEEEVQEKEEEKEESNGGILNNLISNFLSATTTMDGKSDENIQKNECEYEDEKKRESSGTGILEKILSHLSEDAVPTTEEASILIQSVID